MTTKQDAIDLLPSGISHKIIDQDNHNHSKDHFDGVHIIENVKTTIKQKIEQAELYDFETQELAADILDIDEEDYVAIEEALYDKFEISMEKWHEIVCTLALRAAQGKSALSSESMKGFSNKEGTIMICKVEA